MIQSIKHPVREQQRIGPGTHVDIPIPQKTRERYEKEKTSKYAGAGGDATRRDNQHLSVMSEAGGGAERSPANNKQTYRNNKGTDAVTA